MVDMRVNFGAIATAAADIQSGANEVQSTLDTMDQQLQPLRANWTGEASQAYEAAKAKWTTAITDMKTLLADIGREVQTGGEDYQATERTNTARW